MTEKAAQIHMDKPQYVVIDNIAIPVVVGKSFVPADMDHAREYYPNYIRHGGKFNYPKFFVEVFRQASIDSSYKNRYSKFIEEILRYDRKLIAEMAELVDAFRK